MLSTLLIDVRNGAKVRNGEVVARVLKRKQSVQAIKLRCNYWKVSMKLREAYYFGFHLDELYRRRRLRSLRKSLAYKQMCGACETCIALFAKKGILNV